MQEYVQKSTITTLPRKPSGVSGAEFSQRAAPAKEGASPSTGRSPAVLAWDSIMAWPAAFVLLIAMFELLMAMFELLIARFVLLMAMGLAPAAPAPLGLILSISDCSRLFVPLSDKRVRK